MEDAKMKELEELCKPVVEHLKKNWDPHCTVIITDSHIKLVRDEIGLPVRTAQEVLVQEQLSKEQAEQLLQKQFKLLANNNGSIDDMLKIYAILFPCHP